MPLGSRFLRDPSAAPQHHTSDVTSDPDFSTDAETPISPPPLTSSPSPAPPSPPPSPPTSPPPPPSDLFADASSDTSSCSLSRSDSSNNSRVALNRSSSSDDVRSRRPFGLLADLALSFAAGAAVHLHRRRNVRPAIAAAPAPRPSGAARAAAARAAAAAAEDARVNAASAALVREWCIRDPDPDTRAAVRAWAAAGDHDRIAARLAPEARLRFGTAGLRAEMGPGYDRMNVWAVMCATEAVVKVLEKEAAVELRDVGVVVGFDARENSRKFATVVAGVFAQMDVPVELWSRPVPTPLVAFSVLRGRGKVAGVVVTASHNPKDDNGYKLFWRDGAQIRPDVAEKIEAAMKRTGKVATKAALDEEELRKSPLVWDDGYNCFEEYVSAIAGTLMWSQYNSALKPIVYTAMHGVGYPFVTRLFDEFGLTPVIPVDAQTLRPDPDFSTVRKPNPEEKGALDLAVDTAREYGARVILANDPDADRLGVACVDPETGEDRVLTGDEIAALFADFLLLRFRGRRDRLAMVASTVSSKFLASMARKEGFVVRETLTGFKYLSQGAAQLADEGYTVLLAYEEAIGYMVRDVVRDKDGISAAAVFAELVGYWEAQGVTIPQRLASLSERYGYHIGHNGYLTLTARSTPLKEIFDKARADGMPESLGSCTVVSVRDLTKGTDSAQADNVALLPKDSNTQFITLICRSELVEDPDSPDDVVISLRGSGTEPKVKFYSEIVASSKAEVDSGNASRILKTAVYCAIARILNPFENKLEQ